MKSGVWLTEVRRLPLPFVLAITLPMAILGIDFDNTIVCYDDVFHRLAVEFGWLPATVPANKNAVRNELRRLGREAQWTELQGIVYGPRIQEADPFPGVLEFLARAHQRGVECAIVSHKTRHPFLGEKHDLHAAARGWLAAKGFLTPATGLTPDRVFLELTKSDKLTRIGTLGCRWFIDDLPEFLSDPEFPAGVERILFDPAAQMASGPYQSISSWREIADALVPGGIDAP